MIPGVAQVVLALGVADVPFAEDAPTEPILSGCVAMAPGPVCRVVGDRTLTIFWRPLPYHKMTVQLDGESLSPEPRRVAGGDQITLKIPEGEHTLTLTSHDEWKEHQVRSWQIVDEDPMLSVPQTLVIANIRDRTALRKAYDELDGHLRRGEGDRGRTLKLMSRLAYRLEDYERAQLLRFAALPLLLRDEQWSEVVETHQAIAENADLSEAWNHVTAAAELLRQHPAALPAHLMLRARHHEKNGDLSQMRFAAELALLWAQRLDQPREAADSLLTLANYAAMQGRADDVHELVHDVSTIAPRVDACYFATVDNDAGWTLYRLGEATRDKRLLMEARQRFLAAERTWDTKGCNREQSLVNVRLNLALTDLGLHDVRSAAEHLPQIEDAGALKAEHLPWYLLARHSIAILDGELAAEEALRDLAADLGAPYEVRWLAAHTLALRLRDTGRVAEAEAAFAAAGALLDGLALVQPADLQRALADLDIRAMEADRVALLLEGNRIKEAACVARQAQARRHSRFLVGAPSSAATRAASEKYERLRLNYGAMEKAAFTARSRMERARIESRRPILRRGILAAYDEVRANAPASVGRGCADFSPPADDEVVLVFHPLGPDTWVTIALTDLDAEASRFELDDLRGGPIEWSAALLSSSDAVLEARDRVRLIATGRLSQLPIHALILDGDRRNEPQRRRSVVWSLDLPPRDLPPAVPRTAAILTGNTDGLSHGSRDADLWDATLSRQSAWTVERASSIEQFDRLVRQGQRLELVASVAHGTKRGADEVGEGRSVSAMDIASIEVPPRAAILAACHAALSGSPMRDDGGCPGEHLDTLTLDSFPNRMEVGYGVAQLLLLAGTEVVVAPQGPLCDLDGGELFSAIFDDIAGTEEPDYSMIVSSVQTLIDEEFDDWWRVRVIVRG